MEYVASPRDIRFFRVFGVMGKAQGYKTLKSIFKVIEERFPSLKSPPTYSETWVTDLFGPESIELLSDLNAYMTRTWVLCSPFLRKIDGYLEPIHHVYRFSMRGADLYIKNFENVVQDLKSRGIELIDFVTEVLTWKTLPSVCSVGKAMYLADRENRCIANNGYNFDLVEEPMLLFNRELMNRIYKWYSDVLAFKISPLTETENGFLLQIWIEPKVANERYRYLDLDRMWDAIEKSKDNITKMIDESMIPYEIRQKLPDMLFQRFDQSVDEVKKISEGIRESYRKRMKRISRIHDVLSKYPVTFRFWNEESVGYIKMYIPDEAKKYLETLEDKLYVWHSYQPLETAQLLSEYGIEEIKKWFED